MIKEPPGTEPLVAHPPGFDATSAAKIAADEFGTSGSVTELGGERDQNFKIETEAGDAFVLKISSPADDESILDLQTQAIQHVAATAPELPVMEVVPTVDDDPWSAVTRAGTTHLVRLFAFRPGRIASGDELDDAALFDYGATAARLGEALQGFFHPDARYDILWDLRHAGSLRTLLDSVDDPDRRALADRILDRYDDRVAPVFASLRAQVIHNDLTLENVLFGTDDRISGIIDFGDLTHTALVCDLAMVLASVMHGRDDPVTAAQAVTRGYVSVTPLDTTERQVLADLVATRLLTWGVIVAWRLDEHPEKTDHTVGGVDDGWRLLRRLEAFGLDRVKRQLETAACSQNVPSQPISGSDLRARRTEVLGRSPLSYDTPVQFDRGDGVWLIDPDGNRFLDAYNNVQVVGHGNTAVADAIGGQVHTLATNTRYLHEAPVALAERLLETLPGALDHVMFVNSGSEANDVAWRLATAYTGNDGGVVSRHAYHGITDRTAALSPEIWPPNDRPEHVQTVTPPVSTIAIEDARPDPVSSMERATRALTDQGVGTAAFVFDSLFTSDGIHPPDPSLLQAQVERIREAGGLVVADEVQAGHARSGEHLWGFQTAGIVPDVVTMGKPMGNGHPVAAVVTRSEIADRLYDRTGFFSTFGGNPVSCAAALAVLDEIADRDLLSHTRTVGEALESGLRTIATTHETIGEVRRQGLLVGVELVNPKTGRPARDRTMAVVNGLRDRHVLLGWTGSDESVLKIRPPLIFSREHVDHLLQSLEAALIEADPTRSTVT
ncbi:MAG: aminotransferase class III-fold pyridoxal phosphate-dependent enzyme [Halobacteriota archaeon]